MKTSTLLLLLLILVTACKSSEQPGDPITAFTGATIIDGSGAGPITKGVLLIQNGRVIATGTKENVTIPENATIQDVSGKFIIPGFINAHGHVGEAKGIEGGHYSRENVID